MGLFDGYDIATSGMSAQRNRINVVSANIANAKTTHTKEGGPYKKQNVVFEEIFLNNLKHKNIDNEDTNSIDKKLNNIVGVRVKDVINSKDKPILKYEPNHPDANKDGYVAYPNINPVIEMTDLIEAMRAYEANLSAFKTQKDLDNESISILKS